MGNFPRKSRYSCNEHSQLQNVVANQEHLTSFRSVFTIASCAGSIGLARIQCSE